jgi:hypothetical protein
MADIFPGLHQGFFEGADVQSFLADEAVDVGAPVIFVAGTSPELKPRVEPNNTQGARAAGVVVGGDADGVILGSGDAGRAATAAGQSVSVCLNGICKVKVNASGNAIAVDDPLTLDGNDNFAEKAAASDNVFGRALQASSADGDAILCQVTQEGVL